MWDTAWLPRCPSALFEATDHFSFPPNSLLYCLDRLLCATSLRRFFQSGDFPSSPRSRCALYHLTTPFSHRSCILSSSRSQLTSLFLSPSSPLRPLTATLDEMGRRNCNSLCAYGVGNDG